MIRAYRLVYDDPQTLPHFWEWEQPAIDHLVRNAHTFARRVVQRYFPTWQALAGENARIWDTHYRCSPMYQPWETWEAWLEEYGVFCPSPRKGGISTFENEALDAE